MVPIGKIAKAVIAVCAKNSRKILLVVSLTGACGSVALAIKATPRAKEVLEDLHAEYGDKIPAKVFLRRIGPIYAPTAIMLVTTCGCIIGAHRLADKENAILASIAAGAQGTAAEYEKRLAEALGEDAAKQIKSDIAQKRLENSGKDEVIPRESASLSGEGFQLYRESQTGQFFWATEHLINEAEREINRRIDSEMEVTLNDWLYLLDIDRCDFGDKVCWDIDRKVKVFTTPGKCKKEPYAGRSYLMVAYQDDPIAYRK